MLIEDIKKYVIERTEKFKKELNEEVKQMIKEADQGQVKSVWDLNTKDEEEYYRLYHNGAIILCAFSSSIDRLFRYLGNAFLTKEEAEFELERRKIEAIMRKHSRPFKSGEYNYVVMCDTENNMMLVRVAQFHNAGGPVFANKEVAEKVVDEIGKERLKKYWFKVEV